MHKATLTVTGQQTIPANSGFTMLLDSSRRCIQAPTAAAARLAPGSYRSAWSGGRVRGTIKNGNQAITINLLLMTDTSLTTSSAWEVDTTAESLGAITVAASATKVIDWLPRTADWAVEAQMGGTATSSLVTIFEVTFDPSPSV